MWLNCEQNSCDIYRSYLTAANLIPSGKLLVLTNSKTLLYVLKYEQMTTSCTKRSGFRPPCLNPRTGGSGHAQWSILPNRPATGDCSLHRFAFNQGSRKLRSGDVTCSGLIRCAGLEQ